MGIGLTREGFIYVNKNVYINCFCSFRFFAEVFWAIPFAERHENETGYSKHYLKSLYGLSAGWTIMTIALPVYWIITTSATISFTFVILVFISNSLVKMQIDNVYIKYNRISLFFKEFICLLLICLTWNSLVLVR